MKIEKNKGIDLSPDELLKKILAPKPRMFPVTLNSKNPFYPAQQRLSNAPDAYKKMVGIDLEGYDEITIGWEDLKGKSVAIRLIKTYDNGDADTHVTHIHKNAENKPLKLKTKLKGIQYSQVVFELLKETILPNHTSDSDILLQVRLSPPAQK